MPQHSRHAWLLASLLAAAIPAVGCGGGASTVDPEGIDGSAGGSGGSGGSAGSSGMAGNAGSSGSAGSAGTGGAAGSGGESGEAGAGGEAGEAGAGGDAGSAGSAGQPESICPPDEDLDNLSDAVEGREAGTDTDGDSIPDYLDSDSDGDGIPDAVEAYTKVNGCLAPQNSDNDALPDFQDTDSDNNGLPDALEVYPDGSPYTPGKPPADTDGDKYPDYADPDNDNDTIDDIDELVNGVAVDTDGDGLPDLDDFDSDNDTIDDGKEGLSDFDGDGIPNFRDSDSDNDGISDACEAGPNHKLGNPPIDTDKDGKYDFVDLDSDNDGLLDSEEDKNGNCIVDPGETDPRDPDSDGDGASDLIEISLGSDPNNKLDTPGSHGKVYFIMPYKDTPAPETGLLGVNIGLQKADLAFIMDTTGTMAQEITGLKAGLTSIISSVSKFLPDVQTGIAAHDDYPVPPYGLAEAGDQAFYIPTNGLITDDPSKTLSALNTLTTHNGGLDDAPESQVLAMYRALTNESYQYPGMIVSPTTVPAGRFGSLGFRKDALPLLISVTDAPFHNGRRASAPSVLHDPYSFNGVAPYPPPTIDSLVTVMNQRGAKFLGISSSDGQRAGADPYEDLAYLCDQTKSLALPKVFQGACKTTLGGNAISIPDGPDGTCRMIFDVPRQTGDGISQRVIDGVRALLKSFVIDVRVVAERDEQLVDDDIDTVDDFIQYIEVHSGGFDPNDTSLPCIVVNPGINTADNYTGPKGEHVGNDGRYETVKGAVADTRVCFNVVPKQNTKFPPKDTVQIFHAVLQLKARANTSTTTPELNFGVARDIVFVVPPKPQ